MDQGIRNKLRSVVTQCRKLLEEAVSQVLQGQFGIYASGKKDEVHVEDESRMKNLSEEDKGYRRDIQAHLGHIEALGYKAKDSLAQLVREIAFTHLNRLCAYKMMEARAVWIGGKPFRESVSRGMKSQGFLFYLADHANDKKLFDTGHQDVAYRHFLGWLGALLSEEIGVLFSPTDPANRLFPPQRVLDDVLALLNSDGLKDIWTEDETIGWVYQYFTPKELRDQVRKESAAPRNSYELAFRNQFFTPRYVVEFLTDNTLGRIWYEMRKGNTKLKELCRYMVRRPSEVFLAEGQTPPEPTQNQEELSQEELLKQTVHIQHRPKKDPRDLRILDPACGSGHFLLYCFYLLLTIYEEAYADPDLGPKLKEEYPTLEALRRDVPRLILAHNLHGIDIDLRATQIAALALWLRCQRAYGEMGLKQDRPKITKSNIVCAEPMPGESEMLKEFVSDLQPKVLGHLVEIVFEKMKLAGEAGSLLKIEEELRDAIANAKQQWAAEHEQATDRKGRPLLFSRAEMERAANKTRQSDFFDFAEITDEQFWNEAEGQVLSALRKYAAHATNGGMLKKQLFAEDAERGFAFIDLCQKQFDVVLMNPPFGDSSKPAKLLIEKQYPRTKNDLYAAFVERGMIRLHRGGFMGAITSRTGFFLSSFQKWREEILLDGATPTVFADLGNGVLDTAMVETAAFCTEARKKAGRTSFLRLLQVDDKEAALHAVVNGTNAGRAQSEVFLVDPASFAQVPGSPFAYWSTETILKLFHALPPLSASGRMVRTTNPTTDDFRFARAWWETRVWDRLRWRTWNKGGGFSPYYRDIELVIDWDDERSTYRGYSGTIYRPDIRPANLDYFSRPGLTWVYRGHRLCVQAMPRGTVISTRGNGIYAEEDIGTFDLGLLNSTAADCLIKLTLGRSDHPQFDIGDINNIPVPRPNSAISELARRAWFLKREIDTSNQISHAFILPALLAVRDDTLINRAAGWCAFVLRSEEALAAIQAEIDDLAFRLYGLDESDRVALTATLANKSGRSEETEIREAEEAENSTVKLATVTSDLMSYALGAVFGRWDIRFATGGKLSPEVPDPFDPLPVCSPGMLQGDDGLPVTAAPASYPLRINWDGIIPDDPDHSDDIVRRVREVIELIWKDRAEDIEKEACEIFGIKELRDYFRKPGKGGFWDDHVSRYSKSRRKAPIYWLLQSSKKNYGLWLYYHRLDKDILFKARQNYVDPKIRLEQTRLDSLRSQKTALGADAKGAKKIDKDIERQEALLGELKDFAEKLERAAKLNFGKEEKLNSDVKYDPDLNDGVVLNIAPLWELVPWKEAKNYWEELLEGKYEWSSMGKLLRKKGLVK
jgi:hypothetical protein